jgi:hypothetical protein
MSVTSVLFYFYSVVVAVDTAELDPSHVLFSTILHLKLGVDAQYVKQTPVYTMIAAQVMLSFRNSDYARPSV